MDVGTDIEASRVLIGKQNVGDLDWGLTWVSDISLIVARTRKHKPK